MIAGARHRASGKEAASRRAASLPRGDHARVLPVPAYIGSVSDNLFVASVWKSDRDGFLYL